MKKCLVAAAIVFAALRPAAAAELTVQDCLQVHVGLAALDRYERIVKDGQNERVVFSQYKLGAVRVTIAQAMTMLRPIVDATEQARMAMVSEIGNGKPIEPNSPELKRLNEEYLKMMKRPCGVALAPIKYSDLRIGDGPDENPIPPSVLAALAPILTDASK